MYEYSGPARKRPRLLEEAVEAGDGVAVKFADSFALDNRSLVLLQVCKDGVFHVILKL